MQPQFDTPYHRALKSDPRFREHVEVTFDARRSRLDLMSRPDVFELPMAQAYFAYLQRFGTDGPYRVAESHVCTFCLRDTVLDQRRGLCWLCTEGAAHACPPSDHANLMLFPLIDPSRGASCPLCREFLPAPGRAKPDLRSWGASPKPRLTVEFDQARYIAHSYYADVIMPERDQLTAEQIGQHTDRDRWELRDVSQDDAFTYVLGFENWLNEAALDPTPSHRRSARAAGSGGLVPSGQAAIRAVLDAMEHRPRRVSPSGRPPAEARFPWQA